MTLRELKKKGREHIRNGDLESAFELLQGALNPECSSFQDLILLNGQHNHNFQEEMHGRIARAEADVERARISGALMFLTSHLTEEDLGQGGDLEDELERLARELPVDLLLTPLHLVNCDRRKPVRLFWRAFDEYLEAHRHFQYYFLPSCSTQEPDGFTERVVYELLEDELDSQTQSIDFPRRADDRLRIDPLPLSRRGERASRKEFKKYFAKRFDLGNSETAFEDYLQTGLPKLPWQYVVTVFKVTAPEWDQDFMQPYLEWIMDTFRETGAHVPTFLFFFIVIIKDAHQETVRSVDREVLQGAQTIAEARNATWIDPLIPVPTVELEYWVDMVATGASTDQKERIIRTIAQRLIDSERVHYEATKEFNMERIEDFQEKVFQQHQHK